jgi:hypothetical protein
MPGVSAATKRAKVEDHAKKYIFRVSPKKYHGFLVPDFPLGKLGQALEGILQTDTD